MSINWVMLTDHASFTPLPHEQVLYTSPSRTALSVQSLNKSRPYSLQSGAGKVFLTTRRIVYLPASTTPALQSFAAPLTNVHDSYVTAPWFGANQWCAVIQPVPGGGIPPEHPALETRLTFKDGGTFDFHSAFEKIKEKVHQAQEVQGVDGRGGHGLEVVAEDLPAYEEADDIPAVPSTINGGGDRNPPSHQTPQYLTAGTEALIQPSEQQTFTPPAEPPPGYEEIQRSSVADELERRLRTT